jgi:hypothetical protein
MWSRKLEKIDKNQKRKAMVANLLDPNASNTIFSEVKGQVSQATGSGLEY